MKWIVSEIAASLYTRILNKDKNYSKDTSASGFFTSKPTDPMILKIASLLKLWKNNECLTSVLMFNYGVPMK